MGEKLFTEEELDQLHHRARWSMTGGGRQPAVKPEKLSVDEIDLLVAQLDQATDREYQLKLINILKYADAIPPQRSRYIFEQFLRCERPRWAYTAMWVLFGYWDLTGEYLPELRMHIRGDGPCGDEDRTLALHFAGPCLRKHSDPDLLREIITLYEYPSVDEDGELDENVRMGAWVALANSLGNPEGSREMIAEMARTRVAEEERKRQQPAARIED